MKTVPETGNTSRYFSKSSLHGLHLRCPQKSHIVAGDWIMEEPCSAVDSPITKLSGSTSCQEPRPGWGRAAAVALEVYSGPWLLPPAQLPGWHERASFLQALLPGRLCLGGSLLWPEPPETMS